MAGIRYRSHIENGIGGLFCSQQSRPSEPAANVHLRPRTHTHRRLERAEGFTRMRERSTGGMPGYLLTSIEIHTVPSGYTDRETGMNAYIEHEVYPWLTVWMPHFRHKLHFRWQKRIFLRSRGTWQREDQGGHPISVQGSFRRSLEGFLRVYVPLEMIAEPLERRLRITYPRGCGDPIKRKSYVRKRKVQR